MVGTTSPTESARTFWLSKAELAPPVDDAAASAVGRVKLSPTLEGLRNSLAKSQQWDGPRTVIRNDRNGPATSPGRVIDLPPKAVTNSPFTQKDKSGDPFDTDTKPLTPARREALQIARDRRAPAQPAAIQHHQQQHSERRADSPSILRRPDSPEKNSGLKRNKSVTFEDSPEVRHMSDTSYTSQGSSPGFRSRDNGYAASDAESDDSFEILRRAPDGDHDVARRHVLDMSDDDAEDAVETTYSQRFLSTVRNSEAPPRVLPTPPGGSVIPRPLPSLPPQALPARAASPEQKVLANRQEDDEKDMVGLGLKLASAKIDAAEQPDDERERSDSDEDLDNVFARKHSPGIEHSAGALANRRLADGVKPSPARLDLSALVPNRELAPNKMSPVPTNRAPSPLSAKEYKVSETHPSTPTDQVEVVPPEPTSARKMHHDREKRASLLIDEDGHVPEASPPPQPKIDYEGEAYASDSAEPHSQQDDEGLHRRSSIAERNKDMPMYLRHLPPEFDEPAVVVEPPIKQSPNARRPSVLPDIAEAPSSVSCDSSSEDGVARPHTPEPLPAFDLKLMTLDLDLGGGEGDSLSFGLDEYMTPEKDLETPITARGVSRPGLESPTKSAARVPSKLSSWADSSTPASSEPATITARGGVKLRTRPSLVPGETHELATRRRKVSEELDNDDRPSSSASASRFAELKSRRGEIRAPEDASLAAPKLEDSGTVTKSSLSMDDINRAFDRVMEPKKKSYKIKEHAAVVFAAADEERPVSEAGAPDANSAFQLAQAPAVEHKVDGGSAVASPSVPKKTGKGHTRQASSVYTDVSITSAAATGLKSENADYHKRQSSRAKNEADVANLVPIEELDGGRLFIKVIGVRDITLPIPSGEESYFCCILDNGKHCVTTPWHQLQTEQRIDQEFELIANHDLEFVLTLQAKYEEPVMPARPKSTLGKILTSPKKHRPQGSVTSLTLAGHVASDGSFARAHLSLKQFQSHCMGRPLTTLVPVYNEWAIEPTGHASSKMPQTRRRKPYQIAELEVQMLYVPPCDDPSSFPTSIATAVRDLRDAEWHRQTHMSSYLSQRGADCPFWRRRQFKIEGSKLVAYHASTGHARATINLAKLTAVTDDRDSLTAPEVTVGRGESRSRRKSGFADPQAVLRQQSRPMSTPLPLSGHGRAPSTSVDDEGYLHVNTGWRLKFGNGEVIDFYADSEDEKERWVAVLRAILRRIPSKKSWADVVIDRETIAAATRPGSALSAQSAALEGSVASRGTVMTTNTTGTAVVNKKYIPIVAHNPAATPESSLPMPPSTSGAAAAISPAKERITRAAASRSPSPTKAVLNKPLPGASAPNAASSARKADYPALNVQQVPQARQMAVRQHVAAESAASRGYSAA